MNRKQNLNQEVHQEILMALPWYVNETLEEDEKARVATHLKVCLQCRAELGELQKIARIVRGADDFASEANYSFAKLSQRIHGFKTETKADDRSRSTEVVQPPFGSNKRRTGFGLTALAQAALVLLGFGILSLSGYLNVSDPPGGQFRTLSNGSSIPLSNDGVRVVFAEHVQKNQIDGILTSLNSDIVSGPNIRGVYVIRLRDDHEGSQALSELLEKLRANRLVIFAEPNLSSISPNYSG